MVSHPGIYGEYIDCAGLEWCDVAGGIIGAIVYRRQGRWCLLNLPFYGARPSYKYLFRMLQIDGMPHLLEELLVESRGICHGKDCDCVSFQSQR